MLLVQCLLVLMILVLCFGFFCVCYRLAGIQENQCISNAISRKIMREMSGEYSDGILADMARDMEKIAELAKDARQGLIPNLRYDDWYPTPEDWKRWEDTAMMERCHTPLREKI